MKYNIIISDILVNIISTGIISIILWVLGLKPIYKKLDLLNDKITEHKLSSIDLIYGTYNEQISLMSKQIRNLTKEIENYQELNKNVSKSEEEYYMGLSFINDKKDERNKLNQKLDYKIKEYTELLKLEL